MLALYLLLSWVSNILALLVADWIFDGVSIEHWWPLLLGAAVLGIANTIVKPILTLLTLPLVIITLGLFYFVINVLMLALAEWIAPDFSIDGFWTYIGATIVISIVNWALHGIFGLRESKMAVASSRP
jgi:putative membrane protein